MTQQIRVVAGVIFDPAEGTVLRARRRTGLRSPGLWEFPGGKIEPRESERSALVRELAEELNVSIEAGEFLCTNTTETPDGIIELICIWSRLIGARPTQSHDHDLLEWIAPATLPESGWCTPDLPAVALLRGGALPDFAALR